MNSQQAPSPNGGVFASLFPYFRLTLCYLSLSPGDNMSNSDKASKARFWRMNIEVGNVAKKQQQADSAAPYDPVIPCSRELTRLISFCLSLISTLFFFIFVFPFLFLKDIFFPGQSPTGEIEERKNSERSELKGLEDQRKETNTQLIEDKPQQLLLEEKAALSRSDPAQYTDLHQLLVQRVPDALGPVRYPVPQIKAEEIQDEPEPIQEYCSKKGLDKYQVFKPHQDQGIFGERIEAYQKNGGNGYRLLIANGPRRFCKYTLIAASECALPFDKSKVPQIQSYKGLRKDPKIAGVAYKDAGGIGYKTMDPRRYVGSRFPPTYVKIRWEDGATSWETRSATRDLFGRGVTDGIIFRAAKQFEKSTITYKKKHPNWT